ncbi:MAG: hypothetical protein R3C58_11830 [Parvularculaceae bacterium]
MRILIAAAAFAAGFSTLGAAADPGATILTAGASKTQTTRTSGIGYTEINGVRLYEGSPKADAAEDVLLGAEPACADKDVEIVVVVPWRHLRHMRTQGFYSGVSYPSAPYTQGFYSGH